MEQRILLVDDDPNFVELYTAVFREYGFNFSIAQNGLEALEKAKSEKPSLLLLDIMLPDLNGFEVLKKLKQFQETANITVWMISNLAEQVNREKATALGATDYMVKSAVTPKQVCDKIKNFLTTLPSPTEKV